MIKFNLQSEAVREVRGKEIERGHKFTDEEVVAEVRAYLRRKEEDELWLSMINDLRRDPHFKDYSTAAAA